MSAVAVYACPGGCPTGQCDSKGPWVEERLSCAHCDGTGLYDGGYVAKRYEGTKLGDKCPYCKGDGLGGAIGTVTCSKCGQRAIDRAMWEGP